ncbi:isochorismatase family protein [Vibrio tarriae]|uniref:Hydrolase n=1 Tax=Vibrio tarriae TaxID=2014742 RepID=A0AAU8WBH6_9VIBR|nr:isochorismatase family protein [Vibrio tarriae]QEO46817.1 isochorismatase family protein [Vibrio cholerae]ASK54167.1 hydrolase [Vibrio tarriae]RBM25944.1 isochorismatase family protein [Vibrio tarriae]RBM32738.1 isochorismatase family protein [Vibrio tarriae]RBM33860.1 isochorismatase family protein [Vibrio tarriae]
MLSKEDTGLILIDIQGKLARIVSESDLLIKHCQALILGAQALDMPILWLEQNPEKLGETVEELRELLPNVKRIKKYTFDACVESNFMRAIQESGCQSWLVAGIEAHICVYQTASHLKLIGYDVHLVVDCISSRTQVNKELAINKLIQQDVAITGVEMCLYELVQDCRVREFSTILKLIK